MPEAELLIIHSRHRSPAAFERLELFGPAPGKRAQGGHRNQEDRGNLRAPDDYAV